MESLNIEGHCTHMKITVQTCEIIVHICEVNVYRFGVTVNMGVVTANICEFTVQRCENLLAHPHEHLVVEGLPLRQRHGDEVEPVVARLLGGHPQAGLQLRVHVRILVVGHLHLEPRVAQANGRIPVLAYLQGGARGHT